MRATFGLAGSDAGTGSSSRDRSRSRLPEVTTRGLVLPSSACAT